MKDTTGFRSFVRRYWGPGLLIVLSIGISAFFLSVSAERELTTLEASSLNIFSLAVGLAGSYLFGRESAKSAARELIRPHARSAFRRLFSLYQSLGRVASIVADAQDSEERLSDKRTLDVLKAVLVEQIVAAGDAIEDWRDIVPEEVAQLEAQVRSHSTSVVRDTK